MYRKAVVMKVLEIDRKLKMRVCYCEDEAAQAELFKNKVDKWSADNGTSVCMDIYESAEEFLFKTDAAGYDLIFLDISMKSMSGMELARKIREKDKNTVIVFVTSDPGYVFEGYEVNAYRYLLKPVSETKLADILETLSKKSDELQEESIILKVGGENYKLRLNDIMYVEAQGHYINIVKADGETISLKSGFSDVLKRINETGEHCVTAHRSYAVNITKISSIGRNECHLSDGTAIPVSRSAYKDLNDKFIKYNHEGK